jgi:predicted deacylase
VTCIFVPAGQGTIVAVACCNEYGFENNTRFYQDGADLNRKFPGKPDGISQ